MKFFRRKWSLRAWMLGGIVGLVVVPYVLTFALVMITEVMGPNMPAQPQADLGSPAHVALYRRVESEPDRWRDPAWQAEIRAQQEGMMVGLVLADPGGQVFFESPPLLELPPGARVQVDPVTRFYPPMGPVVRQVLVNQNGRTVGEVLWTELPSDQPTAWLEWNERRNLFMVTSVILVIVGTIWLAVYLASRAVLTPLKSLSAASQQIIRGELDFTVPASPIKEVNEFAGAFDQMRAGLKQSITRQAAMEQERRMFIAAMAHDLRTPLSSVRGYLEGIRDGVARTPEKLERYVGVALDKTAHLERLIDGLFNFARTEYLSQPPQLEELSLGALLDAAVAGMKPRAAAKQVNLALEGGAEPCLLEGDAQMLSRVVDNLLDNALRHTSEGGSIRVGWEAGAERCAFWVQDTGPGIPPGDLGRVFEPLYRGDQARSTRTGGAGLGLAIARRLVEAHGGTIAVENRGGARFTVTLPIRRG